MPTYNRRFREGSLCTDPATANGSPARTAMRQRNRSILAECERLVRHVHDRADRARAIREYREGLVPAPLAAELAHQVDALRARLGEAVTA